LFYKKEGLVMIRRSISVIALFCLGLLFTGCLSKAFHSVQEPLPNDHSREIAVFDDVWPLIVIHFVNAIPDAPQQREICLAQVKIGGYAKCLNDEHSYYMSPDEYEALKLAINGEQIGVGVRFMRRKTPATILDVLENSPAWRSRLLKRGDEIISIDGYRVEHKSLREVLRLMQGGEHTQVTLGIRRKGENLAPITLTREHREVPSVFAEDIDEFITYIRITMFTKRTPDEFLQELSKRVMIPLNNGYYLMDYRKKIILDMRQNLGGLLYAAGFMNYLFSDDPTELMVAQVSRGEIMSPLITLDFFLGMYPVPYGIFKGLSYVVLIDSHTASAAEIFAEYIHQKTGAPRVGRKSRGKGSIQTIMPLPDGGALSLTTGEYLVGPQQTRINGIGIQPEYSVDPLPQDKITDPEDETSFIDIPNDPQLQKALELLR